MKNLLPLKVLLGIVLAVLALFLIAKTRTAWAERDYVGKAVRDRDVMTISGTGKVTAKPDLAQVDVGLFSEGASVATVQAGNTSKMNAIIAALKDMGIAADDIQTSGYNLQPKINWNEGRQTINGYTLSQNMNIKVRDLEKVGEVLEKSVSLGANQIQGVRFTVDDPTSLQDEARLEAIQDAKKKAEALAEAVGLHIVKVVTFSESGGYMPPEAMMYDSASVGLQRAAPQIESGTLDVNMTVSVTFEVR